MSKIEEILNKTEFNNIKSFIEKDGIRPTLIMLLFTSATLPVITLVSLFTMFGFYVEYLSHSFEFINYDYLHLVSNFILSLAFSTLIIYGAVAGPMRMMGDEAIAIYLMIRKSPIARFIYSGSFKKFKGGS